MHFMKKSRLLFVRFFSWLLIISSSTFAILCLLGAFLVIKEDISSWLKTGVAQSSTELWLLDVYSSWLAKIEWIGVRKLLYGPVRILPVSLVLTLLGVGVFAITRFLVNAYGDAEKELKIVGDDPWKKGSYKPPTD
jgi:hypothetical protein